MGAQKYTIGEQPKGGVAVSMSTTVEAGAMVRRFVREDSAIYGGTQPARRALARRLSVSPGTLRSASVGRLKRICVDFFAALKREEMRRLNQAILKAEADLAMVRQIGLDADSSEFRTAQAAVLAARKVMEG